MPLIGDVPVIEMRHLGTPADSPTGAKGVGEGGAIITPPVLFNAVMDALAPVKVSIEALPLSPDRILSALRNAASEVVADAL